MTTSSQCHPHQDRHQQSLGHLFLKLIGLTGNRRQSAPRSLLNTADLPASLRRDIGLGPNGTRHSFEDKWRQELECLRR